MKPQFIKTIMVAGLCAAQMIAFNSSAQTGVTWNPGATSPAFWTDPNNWGGTLPVSGYKAFFNDASHTPCIVNSAVGGCQISLGDSGAGPDTIIVTNGGFLASGDLGFGNIHDNAWTGLGTSGTGVLIVENGGEVKFNFHLWIALNDTGTGTLIMNGGVASCTNHPDANWRLGSPNGLSTSHIYMNGGTLLLGKWDSGNITGASKLDIGAGKVVVTGGDRVNNVNVDVTAGRIIAYGGTGTIHVDYNQTTPNMTTITATPGGGGGGGSTITGINVSNGTVTITYTTTALTAYHIERSSAVAPTSWSLVVGSNTVGTGNPATYSFAQGGPLEFYRIVSP